MTTTEAFEAKYQRSAEDPSSAEILAVFTDGWNARFKAANEELPEPFGYLPFPGEFYPSDEIDHEIKNDPFVTRVYSANQMREVYQAATERAAKQCEQRADAYRSTNAPGWHNVVHECTQCAAAIRGTP